MTTGPRDEPGVGETIVATPEAEGEAETASIEEAVVRCTSAEKLDARISFGGKGNKVTLVVGFDRVADGATTPASAARWTASVGWDSTEEEAIDGATAVAAGIAPKTASCEAIACCKAIAPGVAATGVAVSLGVATVVDAVVLLGFATVIATAVPPEVVISLDVTGDAAPTTAPMPLPPPKTNRPPLPIVSNPLLGNAAAVVASNVPPLIVVPPL